MIIDIILVIIYLVGVFCLAENCHMLFEEDTSEDLPKIWRILIGICWPVFLSCMIISSVIGLLLLYVIQWLEDRRHGRV